MKEHELSDQTDISQSEIYASVVSVHHRSYLSTQHLYAARYAAEAAREEESLLSLGRSNLGMRLRCAALTAIVESVAFLEAAINEILQNVADGIPIHPRDSLDDRSKDAIKAIWEAADQGRMGTLEKYQVLLLCSGAEPLERGSSPYQEAKLLIELRNHVIHFKPSWVTDGDPWKITRKLENRFPRNNSRAIGNDTWSDRDLFGAGCAEWTWRSARSLTDEVARRLDLTFNYQIPFEGDPLPE